MLIKVISLFGTGSFYWVSSGVRPGVVYLAWLLMHSHAKIF